MGLVSLVAYDHQDNAYLSPYKEMTIGILVFDPALFEGYYPIYIVDLVLNSEAAAWKGVQGWGLPEILGQTHCHTIQPKGIRCMAEADGQLILRMDINVENGVASPPDPILLMAVKEDYLTRAAWVGEGTIFSNTIAGGATLKFGEHPLGQYLEALGVGAIPSVQQLWGSDLA